MFDFFLNSKYQKIEMTKSYFEEPRVISKEKINASFILAERYKDFFYLRHMNFNTMY